MATYGFRLPDLGEGLEDAEVIRWLVAEGDEVTLNQPLIEVDTAKALVEIPSPVAGRVATLHAAEGAVVEVGALLVTFEVEGEAPPEGGRRSVLVGYGVDDAERPRRRRRLHVGGPARRAAGAGAPSRDQEGVLTSPVVRKLAADLGVDLGSVSGTGPGGRVLREDVLGAAEGQKAAPLPGTGGPVEGEERLPVRGVRRVVAEKMSRAAREIPQVTTFLTIEASELLKARDAAQAKAGEATKVTPLAVVARALVEILPGHPKLNASYDSERGEVVLKRYCNLGIATDTERGLIVPVIRDARRLTAAELAAEISRLAQAARDGTARPEDLTGGTVTISNVGSFGSEYGTPIVNPPESAILALGVIEDRPVVRDGQVVIRPVAVLSLSFDHRVLDGAEAGRGLLALRQLLESPSLFDLD